MLTFFCFDCYKLVWSGSNECETSKLCLSEHFYASSQLEKD